MSTSLRPPPAADAPAAPPRRPVQSIDPATGAVWREFAAATPDEVTAAVARAREAQAAWAGRGVAARAACLREFRGVLYRRRGEVADILTRENGKPPMEALGSEVQIVLDYARFYAKVAAHELRGTAFTPASPAMWRKRVSTIHEPHGVVAVISPWNFPFMLAAGVVVPALVAGNAVILKPSEFTPSSGEILGTLLREAGVPDGVLQVVQGDGVTGAALVAAAVDKVFFTGSEATGRRVALECASRLVPCSLELGGSDPAIVLEDAELETAADGILWGRFSNAGQTCVAPKRVIVVDAVHDRFVAALASRVRALRVGAGATHAEVGPLIRPSQVTAIRAQLDDAVARGAQVAATAEMPDVSPDDRGRFFPPTLLTGVTTGMRVLSEETFGPLLPVIRARDADDAVRLANRSPFGLSASIWSRDVRGAERLAGTIEAGTVAINDSVIVAGMAEVAHGGVKASGMGRSHGLAGLHECVRTKTIVAERFTALRQPWWFGYSATHARNLDGFLGFAHGDTLGARLRGAWRSLQLVFRGRGGGPGRDGDPASKSGS